MLKTLITYRNNLLFFAFCGILSMLFAFINYYPFIFPDTGTYIYSGFERFIPNDRPIFYGLFVRHSSLATSLWLTAWIQGILVSYQMYLIYKYYFSENRVLFLVVILLLSLLTTYSFYVSFINPDIFLPLLVLSFWNLVHIPQKKINTIFTFIILVYSSVVGYSNLFLLISITFSYLLYKIYIRRFKIKQALWIISPIAASFLLIFAYSYAIDGKVRLSKGSNVFLFNKLWTIGIAQETLKEHCDKKNWKICEYKESIIKGGYDFLWDTQQSPLYKTGWKEAEKELGEVIFLSVSDHRNHGKLVIAGITGTLSLLFAWDLGDIPIYMVDKPDFPPSVQIKDRYKTEYQNYIRGSQYKGNLSFTYFNLLHKSVLGLSIIYLLYLLLIRKKEQVLHSFFIFILVAMVLNAFICVNLSDLAYRYQTRTLFLVVFVAILCGIKQLKMRNLV